MRMSNREKEDPHMSLRGLGIKDSFEIFRSAVTTVFKKAGKAMPQSISDDLVAVVGSTKDPNKTYHYRSVIFDCRDTQNWHFYADRDTIVGRKRLYVAKDLIEELNNIKKKFRKEQIRIVINSKIEVN